MRLTCPYRILRSTHPTCLSPLSKGDSQHTCYYNHVLWMRCCTQAFYQQTSQSACAYLCISPSNLPLPHPARALKPSHDKLRRSLSPFFERPSHGLCILLCSLRGSNGARGSVGEEGHNTLGGSQHAQQCVELFGNTWGDRGSPSESSGDSCRLQRRYASSLTGLQGQPAEIARLE